MVEMATGLLTAEAFFRLPDDGRSLELVGGEVVEMPDGGGVHGRVAQKVNMALANFVTAHGLGEVPAPNTGFELARDIVRKPDVSFVPKSDCKEPPPVGWIPGSPALAVEVLSPNDRIWDIERKVREYLEHGTREVWIVNPFSKTVQVVTAGRKPAILAGDDRLESPDLLPGFSVLAGSLFEP